MVKISSFLRMIACPFALLFILVACDSDRLELWIVKSETPLFASPVDDELKQIHILKKGNVCTPGKVKMAKVYQYFEVLCEDKNYGWVIDYDNFDVLKSELR